MILGLALWISTFAALPAQQGDSGSPHAMTSWGLVLRTPAMESVRVTESSYPIETGEQLAFDLYAPGERSAPLPVVVLLTLGTSPTTYKRPQYADWARLLASEGLAAITLQVRWEKQRQDVPAFLKHLRSNASALGIDPGRLGALGASGIVPATYEMMIDPALNFRCAALLYGAPYEYASSKSTALLILRAGKDDPVLNERIDQLATTAVAAGGSVTLVNYPTGHHAFDILDDTPESRRIIQLGADYFRLHLTSGARLAPRPSPARTGLAHYAAGEWSEAADAYEAYVQVAPDDAVAWFRLANCGLHLGDDERALPALERTGELGYRADLCFFNAACLHAVAGRESRALDCLEQSVEAGFLDAALVRTDDDLSALKGHERFEQILADLER